MVLINPSKQDNIDMADDLVISPGALGRIGRKLFIVFLGPRIVSWDSDSDFLELEKRLQEIAGDKKKRFSGLDLTNIFVMQKSREELIKELRKWQPRTQGRIHDLIVALRPPYVFTCETSGMIIRAGKEASMEINACFPDKDPIKPGDSGRLAVIPLQGLTDVPDSLILTDSDRDTYLSREKRMFAFLRDRLASHEMLFAGFELSDEFLNKLLHELGREINQYGRHPMILADDPSDLEIDLIRARRGDVKGESGKGAVEFLEKLQAQVQQIMVSGPPVEELQDEDLIQRLRARIHKETEKMIMTGLSQPEHLETGEPPDLDDIYVVPTLSSWEPVSGELDLDEVGRLAAESQHRGENLPREIADLLNKGNAGDVLPKQLKQSLKSIGYELGAIGKSFDKSNPSELMKQCERMVIIGNPASGKSQLLRYIAHEITSPDDRTDLKVKDIVPIIAPVREYYVQRQTGDSLLLFLQKRLAEIIGEEPAVVSRLFENKRVMLLLDGLDEVQSDEDRKRMTEEIEELLGSFREIRCIVTSRPAGYRAAQVTRALPHLELDSLDDERIKKLLLNWYRRIISGNQNWTEKQIKKKAEEAKDDLFGRFNAFEGLLNLVRNPLMLTLATFIHHIGMELPERRADFYHRAAQLLSRKWLKVKFDKHIELPREETFMDALERIAFKLHMEAGDNLISGTELSDLLLSVFKEREAYGNERAGREAENLKELMRSLIGTMVERTIDRFGFTHLSFQEYFAARYLAQGKGRNQAISILKQKLFKSGWDQILRMYLQIAPRGDANEVFDALEQVKHPFDDLFHTSLRRLADLLSETNLVDSERRKKILNNLMNLVTDEEHFFMIKDLISRIKDLGKEDNETLNELIRFFIQCLDEKADKIGEAIDGLSELGAKEALIERLREDKNKEVREKAIVGLVRLERKEPDVIQALIELLRDDDKDVREKAINGLGILGAKEPDVIQAIIERLREDDNEDVREKAIDRLVIFGAKEPDVIQALTELLRDDDNKDVRENAIDGLVRLGAKEPDVIQALIELLRDDDNKDVRENAIDGLVRLGTKEPEVIQALIELLRDDDEDVRKKAINRLGMLGAKKPDVIQALIELLREDKNKDVLEQVIDGLVRLEAKEPDVIQALTERLRKDKNKDVRKKAIDGLVRLEAKEPDVIQALTERLRED
ncbi:MAG: NACHT domain-containing protein, partial [Desulfobacterales bacterium]|nr:NACHT domain-containing protein [Desulfobacterales bacterium]